MNIKIIKQHIKKVDIFGQSISLSFRQEEEHTTFLGGLASIFVLATIISFFYSNIIGFFTMSQVSSTTEMIFESDPGIINLSSKSFMFAVQIEHDYFVDTPYFNISVEQRHYKNQNGTLKKMPTQFVDLIKCTEEHFAPIFSQYQINFTSQFKNLNLTNFLCPNLETSVNWTIGGAYTSSDYYFLKFSVTTCVNNTNTFTWRPVCKSLEEMENYLSSQGSFRFQLYTTNFIVNPDDPQTYIIPYLAIEQFYSFAPKQMFVQSDIFVREKRVNTDKGILMYPLNVEETIAYREHMDSRQQVTTGSLIDGYFAAFYLQRSPFSFYIERKYVTLDELLSYLGGFSQFMIAVLGFFINFYNKQSLLVELANDLYEFNFNQKQENTQAFICNLLSQSQHGREMLRQKYQQKELMSNIKIQSFDAFTSKPKMDQSDNNRDQLSKCSPKQNQKQFIQVSTTRLFGTARERTSEYYKKFKSFMINRKKISLGYRIILSEWLPFQCFQDSESVLFKRAMEQVSKELDIRYIMNQLHEIQKLKKVLFNQDQIELINFSHKPIISLVRERKNRLSSKIQYLGEEEQLNNEVFKQFTALVESYQKLIAVAAPNTTQDQVTLNQRIIGLLGRELPLLIEQEIQQEFSQSIKEAEPEEIEEDTPKQ